MNSVLEVGSELVIVPLTASHLPQALRIERASFRDPWSESVFDEAMRDRDTNWAAVVDRRVAGYLVTQWVLDEIHILNLAIATETRRQGIASALLKFLFDRAGEHAMRDVYLEVRFSNAAALGLYQRFGFTELSVRKGYYHDGEDAYVMHRCLTPTESKSMVSTNLSGANR